MGKTTKTFLVLAIISTFAFFAWGVTRLVKCISFDLNCKQYIKRVVNASSVEIAQEELSVVLKYAEDNNLTEGVVSIFLNQPKNDVGFWYKNMKAAYEELDNLPEDASAFEKTNVLMKLRESLTDNDKNGTRITVPEGIEIYPYNIEYLLWAVVSGIGTIASWIGFVVNEKLEADLYNH